MNESLTTSRINRIRRFNEELFFTYVDPGFILGGKPLSVLADEAREFMRLAMPESIYVSFLSTPDDRKEIT